MRIDRIDLTIVRLPLVRPFQTSSSRKDHLDHILVRVDAPTGRSAGASAPARPTRSTARRRPRPAGTSSTTSSAPMVLGRDWATIDELTGFYRLVKGNAFAKAGLEMACWDCCSAGTPGPLAAALLGGTRREILSGVSLGIEPTIEALLDRIDQFLDEGYRRIKLKIGPGKDVEVVRRVRERYPAIALQVDANSAYTLDDLDTAQAARRLRPAPDRAAAGPRRHHRPRPAPGRARDADLPRREHPLGRRRPQGARPGGLPGDQHQGQPRSAACSRRSGSTTSAWRAACPSGAAGCTSSASAGRPTWRSRACPASPSPATSPARTSTIARTSSSRRSWPTSGAIAGSRPARARRRADRGSDRGPYALRTATLRGRGP